MQPIQNKLLDMMQSEVARQELGHVKRHSARESTGVEWDIWGRDDALASQIAATRAGFGDVRFGVYRD